MLRIFLLGTFRVELDGKLIDEKAWPRRKVKSLLKLLALQPGYRLHKEQALELLWPDQELSAASGNLYRNLHLLRQVLEPPPARKSDSSTILFKEEIIRLNPASGLWLDLDAFQNLLNRARTASNPLPHLEEAISLYSGDLLEEDPYEEWLSVRRDELKRDFQQALLLVAQAYRQSAAYPAAIAALQRILAKDPSNEAAHRELILVYTLSGQRNEALNQYQLCMKVLDEELGLDPSPETLELYRQVLAGEIKAELLTVTSPAPLLAVADEPPPYYEDIPAPATSLVGREAEVNRGTALLRSREARLMTLVGPGGIGKTRIAQAIGAQLLEEKFFPNGVCFVALSAVTDPVMVPLSIAMATGIKEAGGQPPLKLLKHHLRDLNLLLIIDNFEQVIEAAGVLAELLATCPALKILVTSRTVLHLYGEQELPVQPLELPAPRSWLPLHELEQTPGVALFVQRARAVKSDFRLTAENATAIVEICYRVDGLPLAIELVASLVKLLSPADILKRLSDSLHLLQGNFRDLPTRQQSLQKALDWSYSLLDEAERQLFIRLGVFAHGCTTQALEAVCLGTASDTGEQPVSLEVLNAIAALIDKSLLYRQEVEVEPLAGSNERLVVRYRMLETVNAYALERLHASGLEAALRDSHLNYFLALAEEIEPRMHSENLAAWLNRLELDNANLREALRWSLVETQEDSGRVEKGVRLAAALGWFWHQRGYWSEGSKWLELALTKLEQYSISGNVRAKTFYASGIMNLGQGNFPRAQSALEESLRVAKQLNDKWGIAHALDGLGEKNRLQGNFSEARPLYEQGIQMCRELGDIFCSNHEVIGLGYVSYQQGDYEAALHYLQEGLETCRRLNDRGAEARALNGLGELMRRQGQFRQSSSYYQQSLSIYRQLCQTGNVVLLLNNLGQLELEQKHLEPAAVYLKSSLVIAYEIMSKRMINLSLAGLAEVAAFSGKLAEAARIFGAVDRLMSATGVSIETINRAGYDEARDLLSEGLDEVNLRAALEEGQNWSIEQAMAVVINNGIFSFET
ncbi:MAG TPA: tetratricopeptide repeat protein [Chloroflexia bacterium]|nr:tetratricopeptide repeat protein [Chloroflexia bacterium]